jgi:hypothetical protein
MVHKLVSYCKSLIFWIIIISSSLVSSAASNCLCVKCVCASLPPPPPLPTPPPPFVYVWGKKLKECKTHAREANLAQHLILLSGL